MARRGLVSKSSGPQGGGGAALMPKGEKPKGPELIPLAEVARRLRVEPSQIEEWLQKDQLRGSDSGIRPYDVKKFQLDYSEEIKKAQKEATQDKQNKSDRKPKKGLLSKFKSFFGNNEPGTGLDTNLAKENQKLKAELSKLKKSKTEAKVGGSKELDDKVRYLESKLSETQDEVAQLKGKLAQGGEHLGHSHSHQDLSSELEKAQRELADAHRLLERGERLKDALVLAQQEREDLSAEIERLKAKSSDRSEVESLQSTLAEREHALMEMERNAQQLWAENERLRTEAQTAPLPEPTPAPLPPQEPLVEELLKLQSLNLARFRRLHELHEEALVKLREAENSVPSEPQPDPALAEELAALQSKYQLLLDKQMEDKPSHQEVLNQLSSTRITVSKLKGENELLRKELAQASSVANDARVRELEQELREAQSDTSRHLQLEAEVASLKKGLQLKENQIQKVASKLAENEKRLSKAMQESARLTELLIERESRLRELSDEFEQEYRDKIENLDRQVSGLQWKLSLREERIAHLEGELLRKGD